VKFSVIVAAYNEGPQIGSSLKRLRQVSQTSPMEVLVIDGGSDDGTVEAARGWADEVVELGKPNRGAQWHAGAEKATGDLLFFLRADAQPPGNWQQALEHYWLTASPEGLAATAFTVSYGAGVGLSALSMWSNARVRSGLASSDHGICTTPDIYKAVGGFPAFPVLEDMEFSRRLAARGRIALLSERIRPAARHVHSIGPVAYIARRLWLETRCKMGDTPEALFAAAPNL
jgi:glycosyltransferase involved in cell wall biosynthesis